MPKRRRPHPGSRPTREVPRPSPDGRRCSNVAREQPRGSRARPSPAARQRARDELEGLVINREVARLNAEATSRQHCRLLDLATELAARRPSRPMRTAAVELVDDRAPRGDGEDDAEDDEDGYATSANATLPASKTTSTAANANTTRRRPGPADPPSSLTDPIVPPTLCASGRAWAWTVIRTLRRRARAATEGDDGVRESTVPPSRAVSRTSGRVGGCGWGSADRRAPVMWSMQAADIAADGAVRRAGLLVDHEEARTAVGRAVHATRGTGSAPQSAHRAGATRSRRSSGTGEHSVLSFLGAYGPVGLRAPWRSTVLHSHTRTGARLIADGRGGSEFCVDLRPRSRRAICDHRLERTFCQLQRCPSADPAPSNADVRSPAPPLRPRRSVMTERRPPRTIVTVTGEDGRFARA